MRFRSLARIKNVMACHCSAPNGRPLVIASSLFQYTKGATVIEIRKGQAAQPILSRSHPK